METSPAAAPTAARWMGVGRSVLTAAGDATAAAVAAATVGPDARLVVLFCSPAFDMADVAAAAAAAVPAGAAVVGCTTSGEIATGDDGAWAGSGSVVAIALGGEGLAVRTSVGHLADGARAAGRAAAQGLAELDHPHQALMLLCDGLAGARLEVVRGAYGVAGAAVPLVGGCAGDELAMVRTYQLVDGEVLTGAVVGVAIGSPAPIGIGVGHGWRRMGEPIVVTQSDGQRIFTLDDEPALDFLLRAVGAPPEAYADPTGWQPATMLHPFGLPRPGGEEVRAVLGADYADRSLFCGDVPQGTVISLMEGDTASVLDGTGVACDDALAALDGAAPVGLVAFDCAARRGILGADGVRAELDVFADRVPGVPVGGFYTYGEFARSTGSRGVHNATLVVMALA